MKYENLIYGLGAIVIIAGALMKISHLPFATLILLSGLIGMSVFQSWHVTQLKKRIKELEGKSSNL